MEYAAKQPIHSYIQIASHKKSISALHSFIRLQFSSERYEVSLILRPFFHLIANFLILGVTLFDNCTEAKPNSKVNSKLSLKLKTYTKIDSFSN